MSTGFELATSGTFNMMTNAAAEGKPAADLAPSPFEGGFKGVGMGIMRGGAQAARAVSLLGAAMPIAYDKLTGGGTEQQDEYFRAHDRFKGAVDFWTPKPHEVGAAGRIVGGLAEMVTPLMATGGNPALLIANAQANTGEDLVDQGVSAATARAAGTWQALATGVGFQVPMLGKSLSQRVLFGAASNPAIGAAGAGGTAEILEKGGFGKQAKQFDAWDVEARATDTLVGMFFGGVVHFTTPKGESRSTRIDPKSDLGKAIDAATPTERDALLTQQLAAHAETSASPGKPRSMDAKNEHVDALTHALDELDQGKAVSAQADPAQFDPVPQRDQHRVAIERTVDAERQAIGAAYDTVLSNPRGDVNDPVVHMTPEHIGEVLLERGPNFPGKGEVEVNAGGYGLVKIIWKHGEKSNVKAAANQVTREDVMRTPEVLRDYEPIRDEREGGPGSKHTYEWQVERADGKKVQYTVVKFADKDRKPHVVSVFVNEGKTKQSREKPLSAARVKPESPSGAPTAAAGDTHPESFSIGTPGGQGDAAANVAHAGEPGKSTPPAPEVAAAHEAIAANPELHITLEDGSVIKAADAMRHADELMAEAEKDGKGFDAAVSCFLKGGR